MRPVLVIALLLVPLLAGCAEDRPAPAAAEGCTSTLDASKKAAEPTWVLETSKGTIRVTLFCDKTPITAQNIVKLSESGFYDGTKFHRVIVDFMDQGGDPKTKDDSLASQWGTGGPGYAIKDEYYCANGKTVSNVRDCDALGLKHDAPGIASMANSGPGTGGSQFFLTAVETPWLDGKHAIFGKAADQASLDVILAINKAPKGPGDRPNPPIVLERATIEWS